MTDKAFREIAAAEQSGGPRSLRNIAQKLLDLAASGDLPAIREIADRLDGKPVQMIAGDSEAGPIELSVRWVQPQDANSVPAVLSGKTSSVSRASH